MREGTRHAVESASAAALTGRLADQYSSAALALIDASQVWGAALVICCGIDVLAGLRAGRTGYRASGKDFVAFVTVYMPVFAALPPGNAGLASAEAKGGPRARLSWAVPRRRAVESCGEVLYRGYRSGLIHQGVTPPGLQVVDADAGTTYSFEVDHLNGEVAYKMSLNVRPFQTEFVRAAHNYMRDLDASENLRTLFWNRWQFVTGPQWALEMQ